MVFYFKLAVALVLICLASTKAHSSTIEEQVTEIFKLEQSQQLHSFERLFNNNQLSVTEKFTALKHFAFQLVINNQLDLALDKAKQAYEFASANQLSFEQGVSNKLVGIVYYYQGDHRQALAFYEKALSYFDQNDVPVETANVLNNIGLVQKQLSLYSAAIKSYQRAVPLYLEHGSEYDAVDVRYNIAGLYISLRRFDKAIEILEASIEFYRGQNAGVDLARAQADLGVAYKSSGNYALALQHLNQALDYFLANEDDYNIAATFHNLAEVQLLMGLPLKAIAMAQRGIEYSELSGHKVAKVGNLRALSTGLFMQGEDARAMLAINKGIEIAESTDYQTSIGSSLVTKALITASQQEPIKAVNILNQYIALIRDRYNSELNAQLTEFETIQLEQKLVLLEKENVLNEQKQRQLTSEFYYSLVAVTLFGLLLLVSYKKLKDSQLKKELALQVDIRTKQLSEANSQLLALSLLDGLTNIHNRRSFDRDLQKLWDESKLGSGEFLLMLLDIDHFKRINDQYGHLVGDEVIKHIAKLLNSTVRETDRVYRIGGEEFAILFTHHEIEAVQQTFERIRQLLKQDKTIQGINFNITVSGGLAAIDEGFESINAFIDKADTRLYHAKRAGRDQLVFN